MSDVIDMACEREQRDRELAIANAARSAPAMPPTGVCYYCQDEVSEGARFCDAYCRDDFSALKSAEVRRGL